jgi:hypothetical protein
MPALCYLSEVAAFGERDRAPNPVASDLARLIGKGASRVSEVAHFDVSQAGDRGSAARRSRPRSSRKAAARRSSQRSPPRIGSRQRPAQRVDGRSCAERRATAAKHRAQGGASPATGAAWSRSRAIDRGNTDDPAKTSLAHAFDHRAGHVERRMQTRQRCSEAPVKSVG